MALAGNKVDLDANRKVKIEDAQAFCDENGLLFMETSAKTAANVNELFVAIAKKLPKQQPQRAQSTRIAVVDSNSSQQQTQKSGGCCS
jgi:Ras-related protein Rab-5C